MVEDLFADPKEYVRDHYHYAHVNALDLKGELRSLLLILCRPADSFVAHLAGWTHKPSILLPPFTTRTSAGKITHPPRRDLSIPLRVSGGVEVGVWRARRGPAAPVRQRGPGGRAKGVAVGGAKGREQGDDGADV